MPDEALPDLRVARASALDAARKWHLELDEPFPMSAVSYVAPSGDAVVKVPWEGDDESLHEADALTKWNGNGAVRLLARSGPALLEERAIPGEDISRMPDELATAIAIEIGSRLWREAGPPFRPVGPQVARWLDRAERDGSPLAPAARELFEALDPGETRLVHGDFHHYNILRHGTRYVAIDPKPYLADREYDVPSFLWNPMDNRMEDRTQTERRIAAFVEAGLDEGRIRAWTVIRGAYLRPTYADQLRALL